MSTPSFITSTLPVAYSTDMGSLVTDINRTLMTYGQQLQQLSDAMNTTKIVTTTDGTGGGTASGGSGASIYPLAPLSVDRINIVNQAVNAIKIANASITEAQVAVNTITGGLTGNIASATIEGYNIVARTIQAGQIAALTITGNEIAGNTITASKINVLTLSAIVADMGTLTAGNITLDASGFIRGGATAYNTGTGFWMGYASSAYQFFIGTAAGNKLTWDGSALAIVGSITATTGVIGGWTIGTTTLSKNNVTLDSNGQLVLGTLNDVVYISASDVTYRLWVGNATASSAAFSVTKAGILTATGATLTSAGTNGNKFAAGVSGTILGDVNFEHFKFYNSGTDCYLTLLNGTTSYLDCQISSGSGYFQVNQPANPSFSRIQGDGSILLYNPVGVKPLEILAATYRFSIDSSGYFQFGSASTYDTNFYRSGTRTLKTDSNFVLGLDSNSTVTSLLVKNYNTASSCSPSIYLQKFDGGNYLGARWYLIQDASSFATVRSTITSMSGLGAELDTISFYGGTTKIHGAFLLGTATVSYGANDSGGTGYKLLRVPN